MTGGLVLRAAAGALALGLAAAPAIGAPGPDDVEGVFATQLDAAHLPGGAFAVVTADGVDATGVGSVGGTEVTASTPFVIGSTTKSFTALAIMQLVDSGDLSLDAEVRDFVPELSLADGEPVDEITVRHLLQQTSGLDDLAGGPLLASAADGTPLEAVAEIAGSELRSSPGETWRYANVNYVLAGLVLERASGMSYSRYVEERIFAPLGMDDSTARGRSADASPGHRFWFGVPVESGPTVRKAVLAAGYLISTADDLGHYLAMYLAGGVTADGTRVVSRASLQTMLMPGPVATLGPWADGMSSRYAMGWFVGGPWTADAVFHPGNSPDSSAMLALFPRRDLAVATLVPAGHELPVPGNPALTDRMSRNVIHAALGEPVPKASTLTTLYLVFDAVALLLVGLACLGCVRAVYALRNGRSPAHRVRAAVGVLLRVVGVVALVTAPVLLGGWSAVGVWAPDLAVVITCLACLLATTAALRLVRLVRLARLGHGREPEREPGDGDPSITGTLPTTGPAAR